MVPFTSLDTLPSIQVTLLVNADASMHKQHFTLSASRGGFNHIANLQLNTTQHKYEGYEMMNGRKEENIRYRYTFIFGFHSRLWFFWLNVYVTHVIILPLWGY